MKEISRTLFERLKSSLYNRTEELHWLQNITGEIYENESILKTYPPLFVNFWGRFVRYSCPTDVDLACSHGGANVFAEMPRDFL
jgi:hypothetical protein